MPVGDSIGERFSRRRFVQTVGAGALAGAAGCVGGFGGGGGSSDDTVKVGAVYPLSGSVAETGQNIQKFIQSAADDIINVENSEVGSLSLASGAGLPNLDGAQVEVVFADHRGDPGQGRAEADRLMQEENVDMLVGGYHSSVTKTISAAAEREGIPHVNFESSSPDLTERGLEYFWRIGPHDGTYTQNMFSFFTGLNEQMDAGIESVAIIHEDTEFGTISARTQVELAEANDLEVVAGPIAYTAESVTSLESEVQRIRQADPDILLPSSYVRDAEILLSDMEKLGWFPKMVMGQNAGFNQPSFVEQTELSDYVCSRSTYADDLPESVPELGQYSEFVNNTVGTDFNGVYIRSWGGFLTAMHAVNEAGSTEPGALKETLDGLQVERLTTGLPYGVEFNDSRQNAKASGVLLQYQGGTGNTIWPFDLAGTDPDFPAPGWSER